MHHIGVGNEYEQMIKGRFAKRLGEGVVEGGRCRARANRTRRLKTRLCVTCKTGDESGGNACEGARKASRVRPARPSVSPEELELMGTVGPRSRNAAAGAWAGQAGR